MYVVLSCYQVLANFPTPFPYVKLPLSYHARECRPLLAILIPNQPFCPSFVPCMSLRLIFGVVSKVVAHTHALYHPLCQSMHITSRKDQLGTWSLWMIRIILGGLESNHYNPPPHNVKKCPVKIATIYLMIRRPGKKRK